MQMRGNDEGNVMHVDAHVEGRWKQLFGRNWLEYHSENDPIAESETRKCPRQEREEENTAQQIRMEGKDKEEGRNEEEQLTNTEAKAEARSEIRNWQQ